MGARLTLALPARSATAEWQDAAWADVTAAARGTGRPFAEDWAAYRDIFADRPADDPPPFAWMPDAATAAASQLGRWMRERGEPYADLHRWSVHERATFWEEVVGRIGVVFETPPRRLLDASDGVEAVRWLPGARLNIVSSCFRAPAGRVAIVSGGEADAAPRHVTYGELEGLVDRVAAGLVAHGFGSGDAIALYLPMTIECVAAYLGVIRVGARVVSIADSFAADELARRLRIGGAVGLVTMARYRRAGKTIDLYEKVRAADAPRAVVVGGDRVALRRGDLTWEDVLGAGAATEVAPAGPDDVINVLFSSGTTGDPKAIPWTHTTPIKCAMDGRYHQDIGEKDVVAWPTNVGWMMGPWLIFATLMNGATMALYQGAPAGEGFVRFVQKARVSILGVIPSLVRAWRAARAIARDAWSGVRVFSSTGEPSTREDYLWLMSRTGYRAPVIEYLGGTEIGGGHLTGTVVQPASPACFTTPALGIDFVILNEHGAPVPPRDAGELYLLPPAIGLSQRLLNRDHHPVYFAGTPPGPGGETLRRHGDRIRPLPGGYYTAQGRADDTMNLGGIKVGSLEIELALDGHPQVVECAAVGVQEAGEGAERLVVFAVPNGPVDATLLRGELTRRLAARLNPLFRVADLVLVDALPRTASHKLSRRVLRDRYVDPGAR